MATEGKLAAQRDRVAWLAKQTVAWKAWWAHITGASERPQCWVAARTVRAEVRPLQAPGAVLHASGQVNHVHVRLGAETNIFKYSERPFFTQFSG